MSDFQRYAIYYLPDDAELASFGASWLGWDVVTGTPAEHPPVDGIAAFTETPRKYGFHGTLKPPFHLADGHSADALHKELSAFAKRTAAFDLDGMRLDRIGSFLAIVPVGDTRQLAKFAFSCVTEFDSFRRPATVAELEKRRAAGLSPRQDELLMTWGYPYVSDEFRFHLTLSGRLGGTELQHAFDAAQKHMPDLAGTFRFQSVALAGQRTDGMFQEIHRYTLAG